MTQKIAVRLPAVALSGNNLRQVVHTHVPLSSRSSFFDVSTTATATATPPV